MFGAHVSFAFLFLLNTLADLHDQVPNFSLIDTFGPFGPGLGLDRLKLALATLFRLPGDLLLHPAGQGG